jgi:DNA-binding MarR family transcriptional regulator
VPLEPLDSPGFLLWHVTLRWQREVAAALEAFDLTHVQFVLLAGAWWLNRHGEEPNQLRLAAFAGTDVRMTSQVVRRLETKALLSREVDPHDTRARRIRTTRSGRAVAQKAIAAVEAVDARFFAAAPDRRALTTALRGLAAAERP